jgi:hypothetical protein
MTETRRAPRLELPHVAQLLHTAQSVGTLLVISAAGMWPAQADSAHSGRSRK